MSLKNRKLAFLILLFTGVLTLIANCSMLPIDTETLWNECDLAVGGKVESITNSTGDNQKGEYFRVVEIKVYSYYVGQFDEPRIKIRIEGDYTEDQPEFSIGEHVFVFLFIPEYITGDYDYEVFGMYQGKWTVEHITAIRGDQSSQLPVEQASAEPEGARIDGYRTLLAVTIGVILLIFLILYKLIKKVL